jgi:hypothetical protein
MLITRVAGGAPWFIAAAMSDLSAVQRHWAFADRSDGMGHERWFRGQHDGQGRPFDWLAAARQQGVPEKVARALYERALQQAHGAAPGRVQEIYLALLADARREALRPSPGKVTRTMRLEAERAGEKRRNTRVSRLTGQPIAPGKRTLTPYIEPARDERVALDAQRASARLSGQDISVPDALSDRRLQAHLAAAFGHFEELDALEADGIDPELANAAEAPWTEKMSQVRTRSAAHGLAASCPSAGKWSGCSANAWTIFWSNASACCRAAHWQRPSATGSSLPMMSRASPRSLTRSRMCCSSGAARRARLPGSASAAIRPNSRPIAPPPMSWRAARPRSAARRSRRCIWKSHPPLMRTRRQSGGSRSLFAPSNSLVVATASRWRSGGTRCCSRSLEEYVGRRMLPVGRRALLERREISLVQRDPYAYTGDLSADELRQWFGADAWQAFLDGRPGEPGADTQAAAEAAPTVTVEEVLRYLAEERWDVDDLTAQLTDAQMRSLSATDRVDLIDFISDGYSVLNADEHTIVRLLATTPPAQARAVREQLGTGLLLQLDDAIDFDDYRDYNDALRQLFFDSLTPEDADAQMAGAQVFPWANPGVIHALWNRRFYYEECELHDDGKIHIGYWSNFAGLDYAPRPCGSIRSR